jgi:UDP-N-acetylmuramoyl-tripeptide--D-alanyl-D-alanine ligase
MGFWQAESIKSAVTGRWLARGEAGAELRGVSTDSRSVGAGQVFVALRGEKFDGHDFVRDVIARGAGMVIIDREGAFAKDMGTGAGVLLVQDTGAALLRLAHAYRRTLTRTKVIAVGGSNGKTTTVRMIDGVLGRRLRGRASQKSFNNSVGVPLTILSAQAGDQYLICEVGTNAPGEIAPLAEVVEPDIVVLTSLGREHLEGLGSLEGVAHEEAMLVSALREGGCAIVAHEKLLLDAVRARLRVLEGRSLVSFGTQGDVRVGNIAQSMAGVRFALQDQSQFVVPILGAHNALNAAAAITVARRMGMSGEEIATGLAGVQGPPMRLERVRVPVAGGEVQIVNDAYNANPESMLASLATFREVVGEGVERAVLILGDMLELGAHAPAMHAEIGRALVDWKGARVVLVGTHMAHARDVVHEHGMQAEIFADVAAPRDRQVAGLLRTGDIVLLKGSRGMGLERVIKALEAGKDGMLEVKGGVAVSQG